MREEVTVDEAISVSESRGNDIVRGRGVGLYEAVIIIVDGGPVHAGPSSKEETGEIACPETALLIEAIAELSCPETALLMEAISEVTWPETALLIEAIAELACLAFISRRFILMPRGHQSLFCAGAGSGSGAPGGGGSWGTSTVPSQNPRKSSSSIPAIYGSLIFGSVVTPN